MASRVGGIHGGGGVPPKPKVSLLVKPLELQYYLRAFFKGSEVKRWDIPGD